MMSAWDLHKAWPEADFKVIEQLVADVKLVLIFNLIQVFYDADFNFLLPLIKQIVTDAGHSANEPGIAAELVAGNEKLKNVLKNGP